MPAHIADLNHHTEITLQAIPKLKYTLRLLVDNREIEGITEDKRPDVGTNEAPVCPLFI